MWSVLPLLVCGNLQLDLAEGLALGREWQLGYWKHPPLPWWTAEAAYWLTGSIYSVYLLSPLTIVACFYSVWLLARDTIGAFRGLIAVLALEGIHFYNFSVCSSATIRRSFRSGHSSQCSSIADFRADEPGRHVRNSGAGAISQINLAPKFLPCAASSHASYGV